MAVTEERALIGTSTPRKEDPELLTGQARYVDNLTVPGMVWAYLVRSPYAHARVRGVDLSAALAAEGVVAAFSGADLKDDWGGPLPMAWPVTEDTKNPPHWPLTPDVARYAGDGVAVVVAKTRALAKDAAELVEVDYEPLPAVTDVMAALEDGAPVVHEELELEPLFHVAASGRRARPALRRGGGHREGALPPAAADPERDRAARRARPADPGAGRVHDVVGRRRSRTSSASHSRACPGFRRRSCA